MSNPEPTTLGIAILSLLEERDMHPYEMIQTIRERREDQWVKLRTGSLYHQVDKLAEAGFAEVSGTQQQGNRPPRTTYHLTDAGRGVLKTWVSAHLTEVENPYFAFSLALGEVAAVSAQEAAGLLAVRNATLDALIGELRHTIDHANEHGAQRIWMLAHEHRLALLTTERDYLASIIANIESKELAWPSHQ